MLFDDVIALGKHRSKTLKHVSLIWKDISEAEAEANIHCQGFQRHGGNGKGLSKDDGEIVLERNKYRHMFFQIKWGFFPLLFSFLFSIFFFSLFFFFFSSLFFFSSFCWDVVMDFYFIYLPILNEKVICGWIKKVTDARWVNNVRISNIICNTRKKQKMLKYYMRTSGIDVHYAL